MESPTQPTRNNNEMILLMSDAMLVVGFVWKSVKRHRLLIFLVFIGVVGLAAAMLPILPRAYVVNARILTHPSRTLLQIQPFEGRSTAAELMRSRDTFVAIIEETQLVSRWETTRTPIGRLKDQAMATLFGEKTEDSSDNSIAQMLLYILNRKVQVWPSGNVIEINVEWHDAETAYLIVEALIQRFLEDQYKRESAKDIIEIANYEKKLDVVQKAFAIAEKRFKEGLDAETVEKTDSLPQRDLSKSISPPSVPKREQQLDIETLERELELKRRDLEQAQSQYARRLAEAKNNLAELKLTMGARHPDVMRAERLVEILSTPPPSLKTLRDEQNMIATKLENAKLTLSSSTKTRRHRVRRSSPTLSKSTAELTEEEERFEAYQRAKELKNTIEEQLANARIEYEAGKSVLDFRYQVTQPPTIPDGPVKPNPKKILLAAAVAGLLLGIFLSLFIDLKSGLISESWQISRIIGIPVLGEMDDPESTKR